MSQHLINKWFATPETTEKVVVPPPPPKPVKVNPVDAKKARWRADATIMGKIAVVIASDNFATLFPSLTNITPDQFVNQFAGGEGQCLTDDGLELLYRASGWKNDGSVISDPTPGIGDTPINQQTGPFPPKQS